jgi:hypothetical protein
MKRTHVFRLYPEEGSTLFVRAIVHPTKRAMREHWRERGDVRFNGGTWDQRIAYCQEILRWRCGKRSVRRDRCVAEVNFYHARIGTEIVTHEIFHATMAWARRVGFTFQRLGEKAVNQDEERLAYAHGDMCRAFVDRAHTAGLYP